MTLRLAWKAYGVSGDVLDDLSRLTRERWRPATLMRLSALGARKSDQFDLLEAHLSALVEYLGCTSGEQFTDDCRAAQPSSRRTAEGKALVRILVLAAVAKKHGPDTLQPHGGNALFTEKITAPSLTSTTRQSLRGP
jgi:hypothetical protein